MSILDTRNLIEERDELKEQILDSFKETFEHYADDTNEYEEILFDEEEIQEWLKDWEGEIQAIDEINDLENDVCNGEFDYGTTLIEEIDFTDYCEDLVSDIGDLPRDLPFYISSNINWDGVAEDLKVDYTEVEFRGTTYLFR